MGVGVISMRNKSVIFILNLFLVAMLMTAQVAASVLVIGATETADPVDISDDIEFIVDVLESGETTTDVTVTLDTADIVTLSFDGNNWTGTIPAATLGYGLHTYDVTATGSASGTDTVSSDVTVGDLVDPTISLFDVNSLVCYGENIPVFAYVTDDVAVSSVYIDIDGIQYSLLPLTGDPTYNYAVAINSTGFGGLVTGVPYSGNALDSSSNPATPYVSTFDIFDCNAPGITNIVEFTDPVEYSSTITITADVTDDISNVDTVVLTIGTDDYAMTQVGSSDTYTVDISTTGMTLGTISYTITAVDDSDRVNEGTAIGDFEVEDTTAPVITELGSDPETVEVGSTYTDAGATALDNYDGDLTLEIITVNPVDTSVVASYSVTYDVEDSSGNDAVTVTRTVNVVDIEAPVITLVGTDETVEVGTTYTDAGATALDNYDGDLTVSIVTVDPVDTSVVDSYTVTYDVEDSSGNDAVTVTRTVNVVDTEAPVINDDDISPTDTPEIGDIITIIAIVTDNDAVTSVEVDIDGTPYTMTDSDGDGVYESGSIDTAALGLSFHYYTISASDGTNTETESGFFEVIDSVDPVINSIADTPDPVEFGAEVTFTADVTDDNGVDEVTLTIDTIIEEMFYDSSTGLYTYVLDSDLLSVATFSYSVTATDVFSNEVTDSSGSLTVADSEVPVITVLGSDPETVEAGATYTDAGATATDNVDGDLTASIVTVNPVDTSVVGTYTVTYDVTDAAGNAATQETRTVVVSDTTAPVITVLGNNPETVQLGDTYTDAGATATDSLDGDLTSSIITSGTVDTTTIGTYTITYTVSDSAGNSDTETRDVEVVDTTVPTMSTSVSENPADQDDPVTFTADVTDNDAVASVELTINGVTEPMPNTAGSTYEYILDTTGMALGYYDYTIVATDSSGNTATATGTLRITIVSLMTVHINADKTSGEEDLDVSFASYVDAGGVAPFTYVWDFGNGDTDSNKNVRHVFTKDGTYVVILTVYDQYGNEGSDSVTITVTEEETNNNPRNNIRLDGVELASDVVEAGDVLEAFVNIENIGQSRLENIALTIVIPDLGLVATSTAEDIRTGDADEFSVALDIPEDVEPGVYDVRIIVSNDEMKRVKHRDIVIE